MNASWVDEDEIGTVVSHFEWRRQPGHLDESAGPPLWLRQLLGHAVAAEGPEDLPDHVRGIAAPPEVVVSRRGAWSGVRRRSMARRRAPAARARGPARSSSSKA